MRVAEYVLAGWILLAQRTAPVAVAAVAIVILASVGSTLDAKTA